jgi:diguanylate cyclase (GGDEF)-like protein
MTVDPANLAVATDTIEGQFLHNESTRKVKTGRPSQVVLRQQQCYTLMHLLGVRAGLVHTLKTEETVIGRGLDCQVHIEDMTLSRRHCRIFQKDNALYIEDLNSTNGTLVDGDQIKSPLPINDGQRIQLTLDTVMKFALQDMFEAETSQLLYASAVRDPLTNLYNRRYFNEHLDSEFKFAARHGTALSVLMLDVDHFKKINDTYGHAAGDAVLKALAQDVRGAARAEDVIARFGGEEFAILARAITSDGALALAERVRLSIERLSLRYHKHTFKITASIGVVTTNYGQVYSSVDNFLKAADEALYRAKTQGRNRSIST